jgi:hypothetical protein
MKYPNKRLMHRRGGRLASAPTLGQLGFAANEELKEFTCSKCDTKFIPVLLTGRCPKCGLKLTGEH